MALDYSKPIQIPFAGGLNTKGDPRAKQPPQLDICKDVRFDNVGGLETRFPFAATSSAIFGGGTISGARKLVVNGGELLLFTADTLYSWNAQLAVWAPKGTHLAVATDEAPVFGTTGDQVDADRAELNGTIIYTWTEGASPQVYAAAVDKATGAVIVAATAIAGAAGRSRVVALATKILFFFGVLGSDLKVMAIDPADPATGFASAATSITTGTTFNDYYDATRVPGADQAIVVARRVTTTAYTVATVTAGLVVSASTKARTSTGPMAVAVTPDGASAQVVRVDTTIKGDLITVSTLADVYTAQAIGGNGANQIAAEYRSTKVSGQYRCYVFGTSSESDSGNFHCSVNWVDDGNNLGSSSTFVQELGIASRAFSYNGFVYFWGVFAGKSQVEDDPTGTSSQLQNTYYLYRDDELLVAKAANNSAAGFVASTSHLPGVALISGSTGFAWCGGERRIVPVGTQNTYGARAPRDIAFTFDDNRARRCVRLGRTLYVAGGLVLQYDGVGLVELGYCVYPWNMAVTLSNAAGAVDNGGRSYKITQRWDNAQGERDRSTTATVANLTVSASPPAEVAVQYTNLFVTRKTTPEVAIEIWSTLKNPALGAPFYLVTSLDPATTTPNQYLQNDPTTNGLQTFTDALADAATGLLPTNPENGAALPNLQPPSATIIFATDTRIFLAGVAGFPDQVWYSMQRQDGYVAGFNDALVFNVPAVGGAITAIAQLQGAIVVFRETATYLFANDGYDNTGQGANYTLSQIISTDLGARSAESVCLEDRGLFVDTDKGYHILDKGLTYQFIGAPVDIYDAELDESQQIMTVDHEIRVLTANRMLVLDTYVNQWCERTIADGLDAVVWNGTYYYLTATGPRAELATFSGGTTYGMDIETPWIKVNDLQGRAVVRRFLVLGEYRSDHQLRIRVARDYLQDGAGNWLYYDDANWPATPTVIGGPLQVRHPPSQKRCQAIKIRITAINGPDYGFATFTITKLSTTLTLTALVPGSVGNSITLSNDDADGPTNPTITIVGLNVALSSSLTTTFAQVASAIIAAGALISASVTGDGTVTFGSVTGTFSGNLAGGFDYPTGEACKLTGLALEVGLKPGTFRGLPAAQKA